MLPEGIETTLIERLRADRFEYNGDLDEEAADRIEALEAENAALREDAGDLPAVWVPEQTITLLRRATTESAYCRCDVAKSALTPDYVPLYLRAAIDAARGKV